MTDGVVAAAQSLVDFQRMGSRIYKDQVIRAPREGAHSDILVFHGKLQKAFAERGWPFFAYEFLRDGRRQNALKAAGNSKAAAGQSPHQFGMAVDMIHSVRGWDLSRLQWSCVGALGLEVARKAKIPIAWGGHFKSIYDPAHFELADWKARVSKLKAERWG